MTITLPKARYREATERPTTSLTLRGIALELVALSHDLDAFPGILDRVEIRRDAQTVRLTAVLFDDGAISAHYAGAMLEASSKLLERLEDVATKASR